MQLTSQEIQSRYEAAKAKIFPSLPTPQPARPMVTTRPFNRVRVYSDDDMRRAAPSVFADRPWDETSENYRFLPTVNIINTFRDMGYNVTMAGQSRTRIEGKREFVKHMIRLRHNDFMASINVGEEIPEIVLVNSHAGSSAYKLMLGFFRLVCSNGMIVASSTIDSLNIRHTGSRDLLREVIDVSARVINEAPKAIGQINRFKAIELSPAEQLAFASSALTLQASTLNIKPERLLQARRYDDKGSSLWKTANVIQENLIKGGVYGHAPSGQFRRSREVKSIDSNVSINKAVWRLTEEMAKFKA